MQTYDEMVDSGVEWLGDMPSSWPLVHARYLFSQTKEIVGEKASDFELLSLTLRGIIPRREVDGGKNPEKYDAYQVVKENDLVMCLFDYDVTPRTVGRAVSTGMVTGAYTVLRPQKDVSTRFYNYFFLSLDESKELLHLCTGLRNGLSKPTFFSLPLPMPRLETQQKIADFLDQETAKIDNLIAKQERLLELLEEKRRATITHAVTRGLDPSVELKETNIPWLGKIPAHWDLTMTRHLFKQIKTPVGANSSDYKLLSLTLRGIIPRADVSGGKNPENYDTYQSVEPGDMVVCLFDYDVTPRTVGYVRESGMVTGAYTVLQPVTDLNVEYYSVFFEALDNTKELLHLCTGMRNGLSKPTFFGLSLPVPPLGEQKGIIEKINSDNEKVKELKKKIQTQIKLLKERRTSLISHAVTGKIKV